ncbi:TIM-barrel domain-containing protein [Teredinibacter haidensis]|uniref:TIM-barrel domain-containing protein n=1 Tax=Teredinibacter haidensis TaxID=2731755 RepID=UPI000948BA19|nr:TIM-barrel domain-containing protein [Teredinibacter haidensis]
MKLAVFWVLLINLIFPLSALAKPANYVLVAGDAQLRFHQQQISLLRDGKQLLLLDGLRFNYVQADSWNLVEANESQMTIRGSFPAKADFYRHVTDTKPRVAELTISKAAGGFRLYANPEWARQTTLSFGYLGDHFFGLSEPLQPDNRLSPDLTNSHIRVEIVAEHASFQENYASAYSSFFMSSYGYGAFFDTFARGQYQFAINGRNEIHHDTGELDWYLFPGANGAEIHEAYYQVIGAPKKVPAWALGPVGWRDQNDGGAAEIVDDVKKLTEMKIPFTSWFVDRPYSDGAHAWSDMNFSESFANPSQWITSLRHDYGLEFMTWTSPATFGDARFEKHLAGKFSYVDLSHPPTVAAFQQELKDEQYVHGVKGHKIDRADENLPMFEDWYDTVVSPAERRNKYSYLMAKVHDEALRKAWGDDQVTFARSAIHRSQPFLSAIWAGDPRTSWEGLQANFANAARSAFMGFPVWGTDVGGYQGEGYIPEDLYLRWMQAGSVSGLFEIKLDGAGGDGRDRMPWQYDAAFQRQFKAICDDRMRFIPYLYSLAYTAGITGSLMQPLAYRHLDDKNTYAIWDQFYLGEAIMAAPVFTPGNRRNVYFPKGNWRDLDAPAKIFKGQKLLEIEAPLDKLPRFIRENSIYVTGNLFVGNDRLWQTAEKQLTIHAYPGKAGSEALFHYVDALNGNREKSISLVTERKILKLTAPAMSHATRVEILLDNAAKKVQQQGEVVAHSYDSEQHQLSVSIPAGEPIDVWVSF